MNTGQRFCCTGIDTDNLCVYPVGVQYLAEQHTWKHHIVDIDSFPRCLVRCIGFCNPLTDHGFLLKHSAHAKVSFSTTAATASTTLV